MLVIQCLVAIVTVMLLIGKLGNIGDIGTWSWLWVLSPVWGSTILYYAVAVTSQIFPAKVPRFWRW
ncbi:hypothetical protein LCGC14_2108850 [marine sediment metagenome]|uniref:Uncharacterized protein n=1 Tax=marine sediment metagenome TaxID=412755 RepID=A0A0F9GKV0_9ZZZZ